MKDYLGREIALNDRVVSTKTSTSGSSFLQPSIVLGFTPQMLKILTLDSIRTPRFISNKSLGAFRYDDPRLVNPEDFMSVVYPYKVIVITDIIDFDE